MKIRNFKFRRCWRNAGGIHFGFIIHFPASIIECEDRNSIDFGMTWSSIYITIGLIAWQFSFNIDYNFERDKEIV